MQTTLSMFLQQEVEINFEATQILIFMIRKSKNMTKEWAPLGHVRLSYRSISFLVKNVQS